MDDVRLGSKTQVWAHRGWSAEYPENTLPAFTAALEVGADGLEFDVHLTKDGHVVVIHDETLDRTTNGTGAVGQSHLNELQRLDAGGWFHPAYVGTRIPTLPEVLAQVANCPRPVTINIEFKLDEVQYIGLPDLCWKWVQTYGLTRRTLFSSFNHFALRDLKHAHPDARIGLLYMEGLVDPWRCAKFLDAEALHPYVPAVRPQVVADAHQIGVAVHPFTVNETAVLDRLTAWGVDAVISDVPDVLLAHQRRLPR